MDQRSGVQQCAQLHNTLLFYTALQYSKVYCSVLHCSVLHCTVLHCTDTGNVNLPPEQPEVKTKRLAFFKPEFCMFCLILKAQLSH